MAVSAIARLESKSAAPQISIRIRLELRVNQQRVSQSEVTVAGGQIVQVPIQAFKAVAAGANTAGLALEAEECVSSPGRVVVSNVSLSASAFPLN
jgi:hypothetical protein